MARAQREQDRSQKCMWPGWTLLRTPGAAMKSGSQMWSVLRDCIMRILYNLHCWTISIIVLLSASNKQHPNLSNLKQDLFVILATVLCQSAGESQFPILFCLFTPGPRLTEQSPPGTFLPQFPKQAKEKVRNHTLTLEASTWQWY